MCWKSDRMTLYVPFLIAAEMPALDIPQPGTGATPGGTDAQLLPVLGAALLVGAVLVLVVLFSRRHQRKRRARRQRNPTLAETGGLPPPRSSS